jgi:protein phosphatase
MKQNRVHFIDAEPKHLSFWLGYFRTRKVPYVERGLLRERLICDSEEAGLKDLADELRELFEQIHAAISDLGRYYDECRGMGATLSLCWFMPGWMCFGHVGDSRIYYLPKDGESTQITHDHSHVGWLFRNGKLTEREARSHPQRHALTQALGAGQKSVDPHIGRVGCQPGDRFLICSDGLVDGLWDRKMAELARCQLDASRLVLEAVADSGRDNTTALLIEVS